MPKERPAVQFLLEHFIVSVLTFFVIAQTVIECLELARSPHRPRLIVRRLCVGLQQALVFDLLQKLKLPVQGPTVTRAPCSYLVSMPLSFIGKDGDWHEDCQLCRRCCTWLKTVFSRMGAVEQEQASVKQLNEFKGLEVLYMMDLVEELFVEKAVDQSLRRVRMREVRSGPR